MCEGERVRCARERASGGGRRDVQALSRPLRLRADRTSARATRGKRKRREDDEEKSEYQEEEEEEEESDDYQMSRSALVCPRLPSFPPAPTPDPLATKP